MGNQATSTRRFTSRDLAELAGLAVASTPPTPQFAPALLVGEFVYTSGQLPVKDGSLEGTGLLGETVTVEQGADLARLCTANAIAAIADVVDLSRIEHVVKLTGYVASAPGFHDQPAVMNGASSLLAEVFGPAGRHTRSAIGVAALPRNAPVEVELIVKLSPAVS